MTAIVEYLSLTVGLLEVALAVVVLRKLARFGRTFPWLVALVVFFAVRGGARVLSYASAEGERAVVLASDALVAAVLVLLIFQLPETVRRLSAAQDAAR